MRKGTIIFFVLVCCTHFAIASISVKKELSDTIVDQIQFLKDILKQNQWQTNDSTVYLRLNELIGFIENTPIDSVIVQLKSDTGNSHVLFTRSVEKIPRPDMIEGYISGSQIRKVLGKNAETVRLAYPEQGIIVPETIFAGSYSKLPIIPEGEAGKLLHDSIIFFPDSLVVRLNDPRLKRNAELRHEVDSLKWNFLNRERLRYNQHLIEAYRDSIVKAYRTDYIKTKTDSLNRSYLDSVNFLNRQVIKNYNDSVTIAFNQKALSVIHSLITVVERIPNEITVRNLYDEAFLLPLQDGVAWFKWIWLKNQFNDSIGIRIENLDKHTMRFFVDESVNLSRLTFKETKEVNRIIPTRINDDKLGNVVVRQPVLSPWKFQGNAYAGFTQTYINEFWSQGGKSSASALMTFNYDVKFNKDKVRWESNFDLKLGLIYYIPGENVQVQRNWHKNTDKVEFNTRLGYSAFKKWYYSAEANFMSQLFPGYKNVNDPDPLSSFLSPAYLTFSAGMEYKPDKNFNVFVAPISLKTTYVTDTSIDETKFGLNEGDTQRSRIGIAGKLEYTNKLFDNITLKTKNSIFINFGFNNTGEWQFLKLPDFNSETIIDFKVNQFISTQINFHLIYDKDVESSWISADSKTMKGTRLQVKEFFTLGISYRL